ncbi:MAG: cellulase family glycosylhydrolase, partial [Bacteroidota bacterium]
MLYRIIIVEVFNFFMLHAQQHSGERLIGTQTHFGQFYRSDMDSTSMELQLDLVQQAGIQAIRDECYWADVEKERGVFTFPQQVDNYISAAARRGIAVQMILNYNNPLYAPHAGSQMLTDSNRAAYVRYCVETVKRYAPMGVKHYEFWNEPNLPMFWDPTPNASLYVQMMKAAYPEIKKIDSTVILIGGSTSPLEGQSAPNIPWTNFISKIVQDSGLHYMDAVSFHQYRVDKAPELWLAQDIQTILTLTGGTKPVWITETGYHTSSLWPYTTQETQADYVARLYLLGYLHPVLQRISYYDLKNDGTASNNYEHNFGLLMFDRSPKPAFHAVTALTHAIGGKTYSGHSVQQENYTITFGTPGSRTIAVWNPTASVQRTVKLQTTAAYLTDRNGMKKLLLRRDSIVTVPFTPSPRYLTEYAIPPPMNSIKIRPHTMLVDTGTIFSFALGGEDSDSVSAEIDPTMVQWSVTGGIGTIDSTGRFFASSNGQGFVIASYGGRSDTASVTVFLPAGHVEMESFDDSSRWSMTTLNMDTVQTSFVISHERSLSGSTSGKLSYAFTHKTGFGISSYRTILQTDIPVPGSPDSVTVQVYGDGNPHRLEFRFRDADGEYFTRTAGDQPTLWNGIWKPVRIWMKGFGANANIPLSLERITFYSVPSVLKVDSTYSGTVFLDDIQSVFSSVSDVSVQADIPDRFRILQNYPNPFNASTTIEYSIQERSSVSLTIFNTLGQTIVMAAQG